MSGLASGKNRDLPEVAIFLQESFEVGERALRLRENDRFLRRIWMHFSVSSFQCVNEVLRLCVRANASRPADEALQLLDFRL